VAEDPLVFVSALTEIVAFGLLVAPRDAARVALCGLHLRSPPLQLRLLISVGALPRAAAAVRRHRSSSSDRVFWRSLARTT
jgi:hypothetical protein